MDPFPIITYCYVALIQNDKGQVDGHTCSKITIFWAVKAKLTDLACILKTIFINKL